MIGRSSKKRAVARHMQTRGYSRSECIACGDSREDMDAAEVVGDGGSARLHDRFNEGDDDLAHFFRRARGRLRRGRHSLHVGREPTAAIGARLERDAGTSLKFDRRTERAI